MNGCVENSFSQLFTVDEVQAEQFRLSKEEETRQSQIVSKPAKLVKTINASTESCSQSQEIDCESTVTVKCVPGIKDLRRFCVHPSGICAYFFDATKSCFVQFDLATGEQSVKQVKLKRRYSNFNHDHLAFLNSSNLFIVSSLVNLGIDTRNVFIVTFRVDGESISTIEEHNTGLELSLSSLHHFQQIDKARVCFLQHYSDKFQTIFSSTIASIDESGTVVSSIIADKRSLKGYWSLPFIYNDHFYWQSWNGPIFEKLLRISLRNENGFSDIVSGNFEISSNTTLSLESSQIIGDHIFHYCNNSDGKTCHLLQLNMKEKNWQSLALKTDDDHFNSTDCSDLKSTNIGFLYLNGDCRRSYCEEAHFFIIDVRKKLSENAEQGDAEDKTPAVKTDGAVQIEKIITREVQEKFVQQNDPLLINKISLDDKSIERRRSRRAAAKENRVILQKDHETKDILRNIASKNTIVKNDGNQFEINNHNECTFAAGNAEAETVQFYVTNANDPQSLVASEEAGLIRSKNAAIATDTCSQVGEEFKFEGQNEVQQRMFNETEQQQTLQEERNNRLAAEDNNTRLHALLEEEKSLRKSAEEKIDELHAQLRRERMSRQDAVKEVEEDLRREQEAVEIFRHKVKEEAIKVAEREAKEMIERVRSDLAKAKTRQKAMNEEIDRLIEECKEKDARHLAEIEDKQAKLERALSEANVLRQALNEETVHCQAAKEEVRRYQREREADEERQITAQKWTPENFVKKEELGKGAYGVVFKCFDTDVYKLFVAKETRSRGEEMIEASNNEVKQLKKMSHKNVINYYGCKTEGDTIIIFMEYMAAGSLKQIIDNYGPIKEPASMKYIEQILDALAYIHNMGIIHCDLKCKFHFVQHKIQCEKPDMGTNDIGYDLLKNDKMINFTEITLGDNLLHDGQGNIKLGDFGIAVQKRINSINNSYFNESIKGGGTCHYLAPEVWTGKGCRRRSDIWSLGCTIVEMLTGQPPYTNMVPPMFMGAMYNLVEGEPSKLSFDLNELIPEHSDSMKKFLSHLLVIDAEKRLRSGVETLEMFKKIF